MGCLLAWRDGRRRTALVVAATMLVGSAAGAGLKLLVRRDRPPFADDVGAELGWSMPSGHALNGTLALGLLLVLAWPWLRTRGRRRAATAVAAALAAVVCTDRLVLGVHYLSDVAVGATIGVLGLGDRRPSDTSRRLGDPRRRSRWRTASEQRSERDRSLPERRSRRWVGRDRRPGARLARCAGRGRVRCSAVPLARCIDGTTRGSSSSRRSGHRTFDERDALVVDAPPTPSVIIGTAFVVGVVMRLVWKRWVETLLVWAAVALQSAVFLTTTLLVSRERPDVEKLDPAPPTSSFPSGHTGASTALYLSIGLVLASRVRSRVGRVAVVVLLLLVPIGVAVSRLYRGMHFPTDVAVRRPQRDRRGAGRAPGGPRLARGRRPHRR